MAPDDYPAATVFVAPPIHPMLACIPATCFVGTLLTDIAYWRTAEMMWADFSAWLVSAGVILAYVFTIVGLIEVLVSRHARLHVRAWPYALGNLVTLILATFNMLIHTRDAWTSVVPWGLVLSAATVVSVLCTAWIGWSMIYRSRAGVIA